jgi:hypothetical protein
LRRQDVSPGELDDLSFAALGFPNITGLLPNVATIACATFRGCGACQPFLADVSCLSAGDCSLEGNVAILAEAIVKLRTHDVRVIFKMGC